VIKDEPGGVLVAHWDRFYVHAKNRDDIEIRGGCFSACTVVTMVVSREHLCFARTAVLFFHLASNGPDAPDPGQPNYNTSQKMLDRYPDDIRRWLIAKGGVAKMPGPGGNLFWSLTAEELWKMGYRKCD